MYREREIHCLMKMGNTHSRNSFCVHVLSVCLLCVCCIFCPAAPVRVLELPRISYNLKLSMIGNSDNDNDSST